VAATHHINMNRGPTDPPFVAALVRMERVEFLRPIQVGDVVDADSEVTFTSDRSCEVRVTIESVGMFRGDPERRLTTTAYLWFVATYMHPETNALTSSKMPPIPMTPEEQESGLMRYNRQKSERVGYVPSKSQPPVFMALPIRKTQLFDTNTVRSSQSMLCHLVNVDECDMFKHMRGGAIMKLVDEVAAITALRHCKSLCVTASVDACNFNRSIPLGAYVYLDSYVTYTSTKSLETEVVFHAGWVDFTTGETVMVFNAINALITNVSIDGKGRPLEVRQLKLETDDEKRVFEEGRKRHELRVKNRNTH
jgi:acyl-coenzyme A thioesterase 7